MSQVVSLLGRYPRHTIVSARVVKVTNSKVIVSLAKDVEGYIPRRELAWTPIEQSNELVREGQMIKAMVLREDVDENQLILSQRLASRNPWETAAEDYPVHSVHVARVDHVRQYGAFVDLAPGIQGLLRINDIPRTKKTNELIELWPDDKILVRIVSVDPDKHQMALSMKSIVDSRNERLREKRHQSKGLMTPLEDMVNRQVDPLANVSLPSYKPEDPIRRILVVDDDDVFGTNTASWLTLLDYEVTYISNLDDAIAWLKQERCDLLIVDYQLHGRTGLELISFTSEHHPNTYIVLLTTQPNLLMCVKPQGSRLVCRSKPFSIEDFSEVLAWINQSNSSNRDAIEESQDGPVLEGFWQRLAQSPSFSSLAHICSEELSRLVSNVGAECGIAFMIETGSSRVKVIAQEGALESAHELDLYELIDSPVNNVCLRGEVIRRKDVSTEQKRFKNLLPVGNFASFLGVPVRSPEREGKLGLFLFHRNKGVFTDFEEHLAIIGAGLLAIALERHYLLLMSLAAQQNITAGRLISGFAHEAKGQIGGLSSQLMTLYTELYRLRSHQEPIRYKTLLDKQIVQGVSRLLRSVGNIRDMLNRYLDSNRPYRLSKSDINDLVKQTVIATSQNADEQSIHVALDLDPEVPKIDSYPLLVQQIILNLLLNAIQQMAAAGVIGSDTIQIKTKYIADAQLSVRVTITDCGPGIHEAHLRRLFEFGFTTRQDGTGQGLYISRIAAEAIGGRLQLAETYIGFGSTFVLELPMKAEEAHT